MEHAIDSNETGIKRVSSIEKQIIEPGTSFQVLVRSLVTLGTDEEWSGTGGKLSQLVTQGPLRTDSCFLASAPAVSPDLFLQLSGTMHITPPLNKILGNSPLLPFCLEHSAPFLCCPVNFHWSSSFYSLLPPLSSYTDLGVCSYNSTPSGRLYTLDQRFSNLFISWHI